MATIRDFLYVFGLVGPPMLAIAALVIWKPVPEGGEVRWGLAVRVLNSAAVVLLCWMTLVAIPAIPFFLWRIWRKPRKRPKPLADRVGWTVAWFGVALTVATALYCVVQEERRFRSRETIRRQSWIFLAVATTPLAGPLTAFVLDRRGTRKPIDSPEPPAAPD